MSMSWSVRRDARRRCAYALGGLAFGVVCASYAPSTSADAVALADPVVRIEEDWMLVLNEPDNAMESPQFHTVMSPFDHLESSYAQVLWNYRETPNYTPGGVQLQSYNGESLLRRRSMEYGQLSTSAETVTWTQRLETNGSLLSFEVTNGLSQTWGTFGKDMRIDEDANLADLNGYSPDTSARESCVTYGSNRVNVMVITQVRYYGDGGLLWVDNSPRVVFEQD